MLCLIFSLFSFDKYKNTGNVQTFTAPLSTTYKLEVWGAQGGNTTNGASVTKTTERIKGGYSYGIKQIESNKKLYICCGQKGGDGISSPNGKSGGTGGYNGGGNGGAGASPTSGSYYTSGGGGGGATHIAITNNRGVLENYANNKTEILIVAGGGGGHARDSDGGYGGGESGGLPSKSNLTTSANQTSGYKFGCGQNGIAGSSAGYGAGEGKGGGGGGWYGGYASQSTAAQSGCGGGGGSGYISSQLNYSATISNTREGNGFCKITWHPTL